MRKEYGGIFRAKYYWEYQEKSDDPYVYSDKGSQTLRSNKGNAWRYEWITYISVPEKIVSQFKKDVDTHFAEIERENESWDRDYKAFCNADYDYQQWMMPLLFMKYSGKDNLICNALKPDPCQILHDEIYKAKMLIAQLKHATGDQKMKLEIHNQKKPKEKTVILELRDHFFRDDVKTVAPINEGGIVFFEESGKIKIDKDQAEKHGFEVEII